MGLNALSGIGGVQTEFRRAVRHADCVCLNALSGIGGVQTSAAGQVPFPNLSLNALSGIGGVQT